MAFDQAAASRCAGCKAEEVPVPLLYRADDNAADGVPGRREPNSYWVSSS